jgi:CheY-like chemotaxis protein
MPGMNGAEFVAQIRDVSPDIPVLVISGLAEAEQEYASLNVRFRLKPLMPDDLIACVQEMLKSPVPAN